ncbi:MAG: hypothetical protein IPJ71_18095 [Bdellovibrionales bacterium]|nr:hypothetical protein [Bdellovibrionales bacterium]
MLHILYIKENSKVGATGLGQVGFLNLGLIGDPLKKRENGREVAGIKSSRQWREATKEVRLPDDIPSYPDVVYKENSKVGATGLGQVGYLNLGLIGDPLKKRENGREVAELNPVLSG